MEENFSNNDPILDELFKKNKLVSGEELTTKLVF